MVQSSLLETAKLYWVPHGPAGCRVPLAFGLLFLASLNDRRLVDPDGRRTSPFRCKKATAVFSVGLNVFQLNKTWLPVLGSVALGCYPSLLIERIKCWGQVITEEGK